MKKPIDTTTTSTIIDTTYGWGVPHDENNPHRLGIAVDLLRPVEGVFAGQGHGQLPFDLGQCVTVDQGGGIRMHKQCDSVGDNSLWDVYCRVHGWRTLDLAGPEPMCELCRVWAPRNCGHVLPECRRCPEGSRDCTSEKLCAFKRRQTHAFLADPPCGGSPRERCLAAQDAPECPGRGHFPPL